MPTPHKHAALIKAWADGAEIQHLVPEINAYRDEEDCWRNVDNPTWIEDFKYRIKPKTIKYRNFLWEPCSTRDPVVSSVMYEENVRESRECWQGFIRWIDVWQEVEV